MAKEILVADPDKGDQEEFRRIYGTTDYQLVFVENGEDALLRIKLFRPDLIIAGTGLSERSGLELCENIKTDPELKQIPFLLLTGMFEEVSEKDRLRVKADGIISKPLREGEIVSLTDQLVEEMANSKIKDEIFGQDEGWTVRPEKAKSPGGKKEEFMLDELDDNEEIIELVEVVEEPEPKMSIDDFVSTVKSDSRKAEPPGDIPPLDSWDKLFGEERGSEEKSAKEGSEFIFEGVRQERETGPEVDLRAAQKAPAQDDYGFLHEETGHRVDVEAARKATVQEDYGFLADEQKETGLKANDGKKEVSSDEELFEKIELEEILEKVERLQPAIEKEWPVDRDIDKKIEEALPTTEEESPKWLDLESFESALKTEVTVEEKAEPPEEKLQPLSLDEPNERPVEKEIEPFILEEPREEFSLDLAPPAVEVDLEEEFLGDLGEEGLPIDLMEEELGEHEISAIGESLEGREEELGIEEISAIEESLRGSEEESGVEEISAVGESLEAKEEEIEILREMESPGIVQEAEPERFIQEVQPGSLLEEGEIPRFVQEFHPHDLIEETTFHGLVEEKLAQSPLREEEVPEFIQEVQPPPPSFFKEVEAPSRFLEEVHPPARVFDRQMQELIGKGVQEMMEGFITKVLPEMTESILNLAMERIETMVKEVIPDLAEKAIREEIERLQKGVKD